MFPHCVVVGQDDSAEDLRLPLYNEVTDEKKEAPLERVELRIRDFN